MRVYSALIMAMAMFSSNSFAAPLEQGEQALGPRAPPSMRPGINIFYDAAGKMRVFGVLIVTKILPGYAGENPLWDSLNDMLAGNSPAQAQALVSSLYQHCKVMVGRMGSEIGTDVSDFATWTGVWDRNDVAILGGRPLTVGVSIDHSGHVHGSPDTLRAWLDEFPHLIAMYFEGQANADYVVNSPVQVDDAWSIGSPMAQTPIKKRDDLAAVLDKRTTAFCIEPVDLRPSLVYSTPNLPGFWAGCAPP